MQISHDHQGINKDKSFFFFLIMLQLLLSCHHEVVIYGFGQNTSAITGLIAVKFSSDGLQQHRGSSFI